MPGVVAVRDSKDPATAQLAFPPASWASFVTAVKTGTFDL